MPVVDTGCLPETGHDVGAPTSAKAESGCIQTEDDHVQQCKIAKT